MNITVKFRPQPIKGINKSDVERHIHGIPTFSSNGNFVQSYDKEFAIVVNYVKFNRKTKQTRNAFQKKTSSTVVRQKHWIGYVYHIPINFLTASRMKVIQNCRNFQVVPKA